VKWCDGMCAVGDGSALSGAGASGRALIRRDPTDGHIRLEGITELLAEVSVALCAVPTLSFAEQFFVLCLLSLVWCRAEMQCSAMQTAPQTAGTCAGTSSSAHNTCSSTNNFTLMYAALRPSLRSLFDLYLRPLPSTAYPYLRCVLRAAAKRGQSFAGGVECRGGCGVSAFRRRRAQR
jgi:hypothetical protein